MKLRFRLCRVVRADQATGCSAMDDVGTSNGKWIETPAAAAEQRTPVGAIE